MLPWRTCLRVCVWQWAIENVKSASYDKRCEYASIRIKNAHAKWSCESRQNGLVRVWVCACECIKSAIKEIIAIKKPLSLSATAAAAIFHVFILFSSFRFAPLIFFSRPERKQTCNFILPRLQFLIQNYWNSIEMEEMEDREREREMRSLFIHFIIISSVCMREHIVSV